MGCGVAGVNHLRRGDWGDKNAHPYCAQGQVGYMWPRETFDRMVEQGNACLACVRTLERDGLQAKLDALMLEFCPDEMAPGQMQTWAAHQHAALPSSDSKKA